MAAQQAPFAVPAPGQLTVDLPQRPRRLRSSAAVRRMVRETDLTARRLVQPLFVAEAIGEPRMVPSMPGVLQHTMASLPGALADCAESGVGGVMLFGVPGARDACGSGADDPGGILNRAVRLAQREVGGSVVLLADLCLDEFTDHGHCGVLDEQGRVDNDATLVRYGQMALALAEAGADVLGASGMMDGQIGHVRAVLDGAGRTDVALLAYAAKYASAFYGPFRDAVDSTLSGDRRTYQQDPGNRREALREVRLDLAEGADIVMVKPALAYLDVLADVAAAADRPVWAYQVSGEYAMVEAAAANGWLDRDAVIDETLLAIRRAGADAVVTYWAVEAARRWRH